MTFKILQPKTPTDFSQDATKLDDNRTLPKSSKVVKENLPSHRGLINIYTMRSRNKRSRGSLVKLAGDIASPSPPVVKLKHLHPFTRYLQHSSIHSRALSSCLSRARVRAKSAFPQKLFPPPTDYIIVYETAESRKFAPDINVRTPRRRRRAVRRRVGEIRRCAREKHFE